MTGDRFVDELERRAREALPEAAFRYVRQGARESVTAGEASAAWDDYRFLPRVMRAVTSAHVGTSLLGGSFGTPFGVAPTTMQRAAHPDGEVAMARAAAGAGAVLVLSSNAGSTVEDIGATGATWWLQMYVTAERRTSLPLLRRAVGAGASAVVLTVDTPVVGTKYDGSTSPSPAGSVPTSRPSTARRRATRRRPTSAPTTSSGSPR